MSSDLRPPLLLSLALSVCGCRPAPVERPGPPPTAFVDVAVLPLDREAVLTGQTVLVQGERIVAVGPRASVHVPRSARIVEGRGRFLMPGLIESHAHLVREDDLRLYLARGITTVRNMWGAPIHLEWRERIRKGELLGPSIVTAGPIVDGEPPHHDGSLVLREPGEVDAAIALHRKLGYDFVKVYSGLRPDVYRRLVAAAHAAGLPVAGHVPYSVGLRGVLDAGQDTVEHLTGVIAALQTDSSPVRDKVDFASRSHQIDFVDESRLPALARRARERGLWSCPTRVVMLSWGPAAEARARLARPEMKYVPGCVRSSWEPGPDRTEALDRYRREQALFDRVLRALRDADARIVVGTDTGNPLVVPGFSVHDELELLERAGLTRYQALRAATAEPAELLRRSTPPLRAAGQLGVVAAGARADLLLLEGNPLEDLSATRRIAGVMARGRWLEAGELEPLLEAVAGRARADGEELAAPRTEGQALLSARYRITWKEVFVGAEAIAVSRQPDGSRRIRARSLDAYKNQRSTLALDISPGGELARLTLEHDSSSGRARAELTPEGARVRLQGMLLSGLPFRSEAHVARGTLLGADGFLASRLLLAERLAKLAVGDAVELREGSLSLGSAAELADKPLRAVRTADEPFLLGKTPLSARAYRLEPATSAEGRSGATKGRPSRLLCDAAGWPLAVEMSLFGAKLSIRRIE
jgi:imidazolonepropionase-like amidohydrolase